MKILFLEPFFGGSHKDFALGFVAYSRHEVELLTLPARFWKWRMRGAALAFMAQIRDIRAYDLVFATDMMDITDFKALAGPDVPPVVLYFHENQLSYPLAPGEKRDFHLGFTNIVSALAADAVLFNSDFQSHAFFRDARNLIKKMPDFRPTRVLDKIAAKSRVVYPGCRFPGPLGNSLSNIPRQDPPLVVWNHRWEYDKNPESFFRTMGAVKQKGIPFSLAVLGEQYETSPDVFRTAEAQFQEEIVAWGYAPSRGAYESWLQKGSVVVSCANQENFGISVMEAVRFGCFPLLPRRLSYPEIMPEKYHGTVLYDNEDDLVRKLAGHLLHPEKHRVRGRELAAHAAGFSWEVMSAQYDGLLADLA